MPTRSNPAEGITLNIPTKVGYIPKAKLKYDTANLEEKIILQKKLRDGNTYTLSHFILPRKKQIEIQEKLKKLRKEFDVIKHGSLPDGFREEAIESIKIQIEDLRKLYKKSGTIQKWEAKRNFGKESISEAAVGAIGDKNLLLSVKGGIRIKINEFRNYRRNNITFDRQLYDQIFKASGVGKSFVYMNPNTFYLVQEEKKIASIRQDKIPETTNNYIGIELEFCSEADLLTIAKALNKEKLLPYCSWHKDDSLRPKAKEKKHELAILVEETEMELVLKRICGILNTFKAETKDRRCGLHIHFDMRNRNKDVVYNNLISCQRWILKMTPPDRRNGEFCKVVKSKKFPKNFTGKREERYKTINAAAYYKHKTLEIRTHEGTTDFETISNWAQFLLKIVNYKTKLTASPKSINMLFMVFRMNKKLRTYVMDRINSLKFEDRTFGQPLNDSIGEQLRGSSLDFISPPSTWFTPEETPIGNVTGSRILGQFTTTIDGSDDTAAAVLNMEGIEQARRRLEDV